LLKGPPNGELLTPTFVGAVTPRGMPRASVRMYGHISDPSHQKYLMTRDRRIDEVVIIITTSPVRLVQVEYLRPRARVLTPAVHSYSLIREKNFRNI
jgi:hypothetical protein